MPVAYNVSSPLIPTFISVDGFSDSVSSTEMLFPVPSKGGISLPHFMTHIKTTSTDSFCFTSPDLLK